MSDEDRHAEGDARFARVLNELRRPIDLGPEIDARVLRALREDPRPARAMIAGGPGKWRRSPWGVAGIAAALAAGIAAAVWIGIPGARRAGEQRPAAGATRAVEFVLRVPASRVSLVGDFNNWDPEASPMVRASDRGVWALRIPLAPGRYRYTFLIDGARWVPDPSEPPAVENDFGTPTSVITVSYGST